MPRLSSGQSSNNGALANTALELHKQRGRQDQQPPLAGADSLVCRRWSADVTSSELSRLPQVGTLPA